MAYAREVSDRIAKREGSYKKKGKRVRSEEGEAPAAATRSEGVKKVKIEESAIKSSNESTVKASDTPSSTLLARNIPPECNEMMLSMLFKQYSGFGRVKDLKKGNYAIEFGSEREATAALKGLNGFKLNASSVLDLRYGQ